MKRLSIFTLFLALCACLIQAQTYNVSVSGQVTDIANGNPIPNYPVDVVLDSSNFLGFSYYNVVMTDANGNYSDVVAVPGGVSMGGGYTGTRDCTPTGYHTNAFNYSTGAPTISNLNFNICIPVGGGCNADFSGAWVMGSTMVNFTDFSTANTSTINSWAWDFGDGNTSTASNPTHTYSAMGTYTVCLTIGTVSGCTSTYCSTVTVGGASCNATLTASVSPTGVATFTATGTGTGTIVNYFYDFGDGNFINSLSGSVNHTYSVNGTYNACVYIHFNDSCMASSCTSVTVTGAPNCQAGFYWYPDSSGAFSIVVVNTSAPANSGSYLWDFGDGSTSTQAYPSHQYAGPGTYVVCVTISTLLPSCTSTFCDSITVINKVAAPFSINVIASGATSVTPELEAAQVSLFPNPAHDFFQVKLDLAQDADVSISLMDLSGKLLSQQAAGALTTGEHQFRVETQELPAGMYMARVQVGDRVSTHKVMIAR